MMITCTPCFILCSNNEVSVNLVSSFLFFLGREKGLSQKFLWPENPPESSLDFIFYFFSKKNETCAMVYGYAITLKFCVPFLKSPLKSFLHLPSFAISSSRDFYSFPTEPTVEGQVFGYKYLPSALSFR